MFHPCLLYNVSPSLSDILSAPLAGRLNLAGQKAFCDLTMELWQVLTQVYVRMVLWMSGSFCIVHIFPRWG